MEGRAATLGPFALRLWAALPLVGMAPGANRAYMEPGG